MPIDIGERDASHHNESALAVFARALRNRSLRSTAMAQLQEATNMASAAGEVQLDSVHLDGLQMNDGDAEVS